MKKFFGKIVFSLGLCCSMSYLFAEVVHYGDYTSAGYVDGDLTVIDGSIVNTTAGSLVVNGDVKVTNGRISIGTGSNGYSLTVFGDVVVTNTKTTGNETTDRADVQANGDLYVTGAIQTESSNAGALVASTNGSIRAGSIHITAKNSGFIDAETFIDVRGDIVTRSYAERAHITIDEQNGYLYAKSITTSGYSDAGIYLPLGGDIKVQDEIRVHSLESIATLTTINGTIDAGSISTDGKLASYVGVFGTGDLDVRGPISTYSENDAAWVYVQSGDLYADYLYTDGDLSSSVRLDGSGKNIDVKGSIFTQSRSGRSTVYVESGNIYAGSITTSASGNATGDSGSVLCYDGSIYSKGTIDTFGYRNSSVVAHGGVIEAGAIFTKAHILDAFITSSYGIESNGPIVTDSDGDEAHVSVSVDGGLKAEEVFTHGNGDAYVSVSGSGNIEIRGDIFTKSNTGDAYIDVAAGTLIARDIRTESPAGSDDAIRIGQSASFGFIPRKNDTKVEIENAEFHFNTDQEWTAQLELTGSCTFDGEGKMLSLNEGGGIFVSSGASLLLRNIVVTGIGAGSVRCEDDTATLSLQNVTWTLTEDYTFDTGILDIVGDFVVKGDADIHFNYKPNLSGKIYENSMFFLDNKITFSYAATGVARLEMADISSKLMLNNGAFDAVTDCALTDGTLLTRGVVKLEGSTGNQLDLSNVGRIFVNGSLIRDADVLMP